MAIIPHESQRVYGKIGIESAYSFGDALFNIPLIKAIHAYFLPNEIIVATKRQYRDAFVNIPEITNVIDINDIYHGMPILEKIGCHKTIQITQNSRFQHFRSIDPNHSLIDTPLWIGREIGVPDFDQRPIINLTAEELTSTDQILESNKPTIAIESQAFSGQSWATQKDVDLIVDKFKNTHRILWLSNQNAPNIPHVDNLLRYTRRQVIACLRAADKFFSVGSGFFCASLALPPELQPKEIVCLWEDSLYRYKQPLREKKWHNNIEWVDDAQQLHQFLYENQKTTSNNN